MLALARWDAYAQRVEVVLKEIDGLGADWLPTDPGDPADLRSGLRRYYEAMVTPDLDERAELLLAGNLLLGAFEQRRVDGYVSACLALFPRQAVENLASHGHGRVTGRLRGPASTLYAWAMTRTIYLELPGGTLRVARPIASPQGTTRPPRELRSVRAPALRDLLLRYATPERVARDWTSFEQRMTVIAQVFRTRQSYPGLFADPFAAPEP